ncbi:MAG: hypothetical protein KJ731_21165 [Alphaproteobacteria bacterium]|uniref:Uncharacterized protein n=1 Tax=viral metagenome TaxID=1070528 RepID=A0A6M3JIJ0_9ZZZZ|nr:hypothetical protein [Alphaproteobacteria bacterium]MBU1280296.1 hypothetical protein [Alphaproteobacteria bacterium]MBU1573034.1 hypothetical protein [Alphaproteobacteria bacterium]MBU1830961.1 hypothetical protein [Alphaproteobacteria bacterium]MBU2079994.1 hypothetical protein [Alphaproteobacteria bacterium]
MSNDEIQWPREIWAAAKDEHEHFGVHVFSEHATIPRWEGDKERDREFHRYVDADILDSAEKYFTTMFKGITRSAAAHDALAERKRQIEVEGFSEGRDDKYVDGELASAALCYVMSAAHALTPQNSDKIEELPEWWPVSWDEAFFKPTTARRDMIKAIALLLAQIESLDRLAETEVQP